MHMAKIADLKKEEQTDKIKTELYNLVRQFVYKYHTRYYPHYKGDLDDLVSEYYTQFLTPKSRIKGNEESLLDKFNPEITSLPYLVKQSVIRKLIDGERTDKREKNYTEKYDEETGDLSLDFLVNQIAKPDTQIEDIEFTDKDVRRLKEKYNSLPQSAKDKFNKIYLESREALSKNFIDLFDNVVEKKDKPKNAEVSKIDSLLNTVKEFVPEGVSVNRQVVSAGETIRLQTPNKEPVKEFFSKEEINSLIEKFADLEYKPYVIRGNSIYFIKRD